MLRVIVAGAATLVVAGGALAAPERRVAASEYVPIDTRQLADLVGQTAKRCWGREPAFSGLVFDKVEQGAEAATFRVLFKEPSRKAVAGRSLKILTGKSGSLVLLVVEQEGVDVLDSVRRDARVLMRGQAPAC